VKKVVSINEHRKLPEELFSPVGALNHIFAEISNAHQPYDVNFRRQRGRFIITKAMEIA
jgi:hypothetical protein